MQRKAGQVLHRRQAVPLQHSKSALLLLPRSAALFLYRAGLLAAAALTARTGLLARRLARASHGTGPIAARAAALSCAAAAG